MNREYNSRVSSKNSERLLKDLQNTTGDYFFCRTLYNMCNTRDRRHKSTQFFWCRFLVRVSSKSGTGFVWYRILAPIRTLSNPYCQSTWISVCLYVCLSASLRRNISESCGNGGLFLIGSLYRKVPDQGESNGHATNDVTRPYDVILVTS